jgi:hypothetical protein
MTPEQDTDLYTALEAVEAGHRHPSAISEYTEGRINVRYVRELVAVAKQLGLLVEVQTEEAFDVLELTAAGFARLDTGAQDMVGLNPEGKTPEPPANRPEEHTMAKTNVTEISTAKAKKNSTPRGGKDTGAAKGGEDRFCGCGCGQAVNPRSTFRQGHDARMVSQLACAVVGHSGWSKADPVVPTVFGAAAAERITGSNDIQARIDEAAKLVEQHFGPALADKFHSAAMNGWDKALKQREPKGGAPKTVKAKVGRWEREGVLNGNQEFIWTDAKGAEKIVPAGKYKLVG